MPDRDLLARDGGAAGFRIFYERHVHAVVAYVARRTRQPDLVLDVVAETFARALEVIERHVRVDLKEALAALAPEQREAVIRRVLAEEPYAEIAERVGCSEQVVRKRVSRGLASLRQSLQGGE
jgi:DNA-directed RNA polymerase specialized sigma24 family protein